MTSLKYITTEAHILTVKKICRDDAIRKRNSYPICDKDCINITTTLHGYLNEINEKLLDVGAQMTLSVDCRKDDKENCRPHFKKA